MRKKNKVTARGCNSIKGGVCKTERKKTVGPKKHVGELLGLRD